MSKINAMRIINLNYNNNAIHVDDETFRFDGESTLLSLRNGGGKSVIVQMMIAPFVHKNYRNTKDRPFTSFFTTNKPTFILVEWELDGKSGYVLTGMMIRKNQSSNETEESDDLEIINFVSEYKERCKWDINNLAVVEKQGQERKLKGFGHCKQLFEVLKKDTKADFNYFDMNNSQQSKRYFEKLKEFQIDCKEWETIIKKVNLKESGLSELFSEAKDEKGLIEKWFIETVENKLNKDKRRIKEFESLVLKYIMQYRENQSKIQRKETIAKFKESAVAINTKAEDYKLATDKENAYENKIAHLIKRYEQLKSTCELQKEDLEDRITEIDSAIARKEYEEISCDIYHLEDLKDMLMKEYLVQEQQQELSTKESIAIEKKLHIQECAKNYKNYQEASREQQLCENRLSIGKKKESELEPERKMLGYNLKCRYEAHKEETLKLIENLEHQIKQDKEEDQKLQRTKTETEKKKETLNIELGVLKTKISAYDEAEQNYNERFNEGLMRNILKEYEPATLEMNKQKLVDILMKTSRKSMEFKRRKDLLEENERTLSRLIEDKQKEDILCGEDIKGLEKEIEGYEKELDIRTVIVKYVNLVEDTIFEKDKIVEACDKKILEIEEAKRNLQREYDKVEKECKRLKQGTVLELPKDFALFLESLDIKYTYGMEWLKKNGKKSEENECIVDNNPFIPYAIILNKSDLEKLQKANADIYTSFPIPIIKREDLEKTYENDKILLEENKKVSFFVMFNKNLLDTEKLLALIVSKEEEIRKKSEQIELRKSEQNFYIEKKEIVKNHKVEKGLYEKTKQNLELAINLKKELEHKIDKTKDEQAKNKKELSDCTDEIPKLEREVQRMKEQIEEFDKICKKYEGYLSNRKHLQQLEEVLEKIKDSIADINQKLEQLSSRLSDADMERHTKKNQLNELSEKVMLYSHYLDGEISNKDTEDLEARYKAITETISNDQQLLEEQLNSAKSRYIKCETELIAKANKYGLDQIEYDEVLYDEFIENRLEDDLQHKTNEIKELSKKINHLDKNIAVKENERKSAFKGLKEKCNQVELVDRKSITEVNFRQIIAKKKEEKKGENEKLKKELDKIRNYENSLSVFAEYSNFEVKEKVEFQDDFDRMTLKELSDFNGIIRRDYRESLKLKSDEQGKLRDVLNEVARKEEFSDEFYKKPIEMLIKLIDDADAVLDQLITTLNSYNSLMEKLEIDIAFIDKEKDKVNELLLDYILEVHNNLGKIDKNSTITIRGKSIKMLRLILPLWNENETIYNVRVKDFMEDLTLRALISIEKNENIEELVGKCITTKNLYEAVVGISNIEIKLYKIEEQREYPITWNEVSKNSGGEGFLSAFVILSSLLYYMRRDDTDLFAEKEEGKVLVMDNPFAQTNSSHLLKPLMDIAKKTNTQLICLSGLGGDSIYNRFDNIYVMNLVSSNLRKGMQYMKAEHIRGVEEETEEMVLARVMIEDDTESYFEQASLF